MALNHDELMDPRISVSHTSGSDLPENAAPGWYVFVAGVAEQEQCYGPFRTRLAARRRGRIVLDESAVTAKV
jgi:hypothetical protein